MPVGLNDLPQELLTKILDYLPVESCLKVAKDELGDIFSIFQALGHVSISLDIESFIVDYLRMHRRLKTFSLSFLKEVGFIKYLEWDCDVELQLTDIPEGCSEIHCANEDHKYITDRLLEHLCGHNKTSLNSTTTL
ncbi:hypothetical protein OESDEN_08072 [Oesophagostomum dentatum]|uniref:F-box domain-containing protein n=1 Tax=Oesophagostomum dentatum TaxID=61180 RepID=A0A0B1T493_OESDE|nr:hypothetical protein OESDEN_08072 [Oesophagostomum dentatum]